MRNMNGQKIDENVTIMTVSKFHSQIATGNRFGLVTIWDLESSKIERIHIAAKSSITFLQFSDYYPILFAAGLDGNLTAWATKRAPIDSRFRCLARYSKTFQNQNMMNIH